MKYASENDWPALSSVVRPRAIFLVCSDTRICALATMAGSTPARSKRARSASRPSVSRNSPMSSSDETLEARYSARPISVRESDRTRNPSMRLSPTSRARESSTPGPPGTRPTTKNRWVESSRSATTAPKVVVLRSTTTRRSRPRPPGARRDEPLQDLLRVRAGSELQLGVLTVIVDLLDECSLGEHLLRRAGASVEPDDEMVSAVGPLDVAQGPVHELSPPGDDAQLVAQLLGLLHDVRRKRDGLPAAAQLDHGILQHLCVHGIEP